MELDDFFENKQQNRRFDTYHRYQDTPGQTPNFRYPYHRHNSGSKWVYFLEKIKDNRKLNRFIFFAALVILAIAIALIALLLPVIIKILNYISQYGIAAILEKITGFL